MKQELNCLHPIHQSIWGKRGFRPRNMSRLEGISQEETDAATRIALSVFTDCSNVGVPFQEALLAIYLSGLQHGAHFVRNQS